jgi:hypothetical protein
VIRAIAVPALVTSLLLLGACSSTGDDMTSTPRERLSPTATPSPAVAPVDDELRDSRKVAGKGFVLQAPSGFQQRDETSSNGEPMLVLERPSQYADTPIRVAVVRDVAPPQDAVEQSYALEVLKKTAAGGQDVVRSQLTWPGTQQAILVQWTEQRRLDGGSAVPLRYWQLFAQVNADLILNVVALGPAAEFDVSGATQVLQSFAPTRPRI